LNQQGFRTVMQRTQPEGVRSGPGDIDRTLHSLRRFLRLAASGNPSILMTFWAPVDHATPAGEALRSLGDAFVGRHVVPRYRGYMKSQAERLLGTRGGGHGQRGGAKREELIAAHGFDTKYAMHCARLGLQCIELLTTGKLALPMQSVDAAWLRALRRGDVRFAEWWDRVLELDRRLEMFEYDNTYPEGPDVDRIERWSVQTHQAVWDGRDSAAHA
jgi:hypothetical protein